MDVADLRIFGVVARLGGMGRAAGELNTVQSNVSSHVRRLETALGTPLFRRAARGVTLTPAGARLVPFADRLERLLADAARAALDDGVPRGRLVVGTLETTAALRLPDTVSAFVAAHPGVDLTLRTGTTCELVEQVLRGELDGAFACGPVVHRDLSGEIMFEEELALLTAPACRSAEAAIRRPDLRIVVLRLGCSYRDRLERWLAASGAAPPRVMEFGTLEAIVSCVAAGLGITLLPKALLGAVWQDGRVAVHRLSAPHALVQTVFIRRRDAYRSAALATFLSMLADAQAARTRRAAE